MENIILASQSPRRKTLLKKIGINFTTIPSQVQENYPSHWPPSKVVRNLAKRKAKDIAGQQANALIIGADTIVAFEDDILEKPSSDDEVCSMLQKLSNSTHLVLTGVALIKTDQESNIVDQKTFVEETEVLFGDIDSALLESYLQTGNAMDKAGAYGIQDAHGALFVKEIRGDYYNVVGFPLHSFYTTMRSFAPEYLAHQKLYAHADEL